MFENSCPMCLDGVHIQNGNSDADQKFPWQPRHCFGIQSANLPELIANWWSVLGVPSLMGCDGFKSRLVGWILGTCCLLGYQWYFSAVFGTTWTWWQVAAINHKRNQSRCWLTYRQIPSTFFECRSSENKRTIAPQNCANGAPENILWFSMLSHQIAVVVVDTCRCPCSEHLDNPTSPHPPKAYLAFGASFVELHRIRTRQWPPKGPLSDNGLKNQSCFVMFFEVEVSLRTPNTLSKSKYLWL